MSSGESTSARRFGTWEGVFTPTLLTILGVVMFLREGWVVGELGLLGAWTVIGAASVITVCTALSVSSIATNVRLSEGGPYAIVRRSLGIELGGSIGIPLFLSQALVVAMYVFGLREGWLWIFPGHVPWIVDGVSFLVVLVLTLGSTSLAFRVQYVVLACVVASLVSVAFGLLEVAEPHSIEWWRSTSETFWEPSRFWVVFAVFFPATTGILAGANMSGELSNPRRSIPLGTLSATAIATVVYFALAVWLATVASPEELRTNYTVMIDRAFYSPIVLGGLLAATFSSALASFVGAPRILRRRRDRLRRPHDEPDGRDLRLRARLRLGRRARLNARTRSEQPRADHGSRGPGASGCHGPATPPEPARERRYSAPSRAVGSLAAQRASERFT